MALALRTGASIRVAKRILDETPDVDFMAPDDPEQVVRALGLTVVAADEVWRQELSLPDRPGIVVIAAAGLLWWRIGARDASSVAEDASVEALRERGGGTGDPATDPANAPTFSPPEDIEQTVRRALDEASFLLPQTIEVLNRSWHIEGPSVRPDHRMVAHTGYLIFARKVRREKAAHFFTVDPVVLRHHRQGVLSDGTGGT